MLIILITLILSTNCSYKLKSHYELSKRFNVYPISFAFPSEPITNVNGCRVDLAFGNLNGSLI